MNKEMKCIKLFVVFSLLITTSCVKDQPQNVVVETGSSNLKESVQFNVAYGPHIRQVYDIYLPSKRDTLSTPIVFIIHGGGWIAGQKEENNDFVNLLRSKWHNVAIVNLNYRLANDSNQIHHNEIIADIDSVYHQVLRKSNDYFLSKKTGILGASAGSQLAMIYALKYNSRIKCIGNIFGPSILNDWQWYNTYNAPTGLYVRDALKQYVGKAWDTTAYKAVSPFSNVNMGSQPMIIFHGNIDVSVPVYHSRMLSSKLKDLGVLSEYHEYVAGHSFDAKQTNEIADLLIAFFKPQLK